MANDPFSLFLRLSLPFLFSWCLTAIIYFIHLPYLFPSHKISNHHYHSSATRARLISPLLPKKFPFSRCHLRMDRKSRFFFFFCMYNYHWHVHHISWSLILFQLPQYLFFFSFPLFLFLFSFYFLPSCVLLLLLYELDWMNGMIR
ncbi:hypothetical protein M413DRAFT_111891 [Hebeloma cylindrosporum]|uniref:Uncharacterized protein n=1 Tax=Hebeloma cylindrosporum TaxID=76867 RepID=A0A0C3CZJ1_HEBCY|nr:hypothetical protein M413DRAFT_111891 [Hebeloma cylindrosporum h7]